MKCSPALLFGIVSAFAAWSSARANDWKHENFKTTSGISIQIDYETQTHSDDAHGAKTVALPLWINITGGGISHASAIDATLITGEGTLAQKQTIALTWAEGDRFTGQPSAPADAYYVSEDGAQTFTKQVLQLNVDHVTQENAKPYYDGANNFDLNLGL